MRAIALALALLMAAGAAHADTVVELKSGDLAIQVGARAQPNLIYQIDCMARLVTCTPDVYEQLWNGQLSFGDEDRQRVQEWATLRRAVRRSGSSGDPTLPVKASVPIFGANEDSPWNKLRWAEFTAADAGELKRAWAPLVPPETAARLSAIVDHFRPRFDTWWKEQESQAAAFVAGIETAMSRGRAAELLSAAARFYGSELGDRRVFLHLFLQPKVERPHTRASRVGAHMTVEVVLGERPEDRVGVIAHELAHHVFARMPPKRKAALVDALLAEGPAGVPAWNLFDEIQATVLGNMLVERNVVSPERFQKQLDTPQSFYADEMIDLGARATRDLFERAFAKRERMVPTFGAAFVAALRAGLGVRLEAPALHLRSVIMNVDSDNSQWPAKFRDAFSISSMWTFTPLGGADVTEMLDRFAGLSAVVVATPAQLKELAPVAKSFGVTAEALTEAVGSSRGVVLVSQRTPQAYAFVFIARDDATIDGLIAAFPSCRLKPGVCVRFE